MTTADLKAILEIGKQLREKDKEIAKLRARIEELTYCKFCGQEYSDHTCP